MSAITILKDTLVTLSTFSPNRALLLENAITHRLEDNIAIYYDKLLKSYASVLRKAQSGAPSILKKLLKEI